MGLGSGERDQPGAYLRSFPVLASNRRTGRHPGHAQPAIRASRPGSVRRQQGPTISARATVVAGSPHGARQRAPTWPLVWANRG